MEIINHKGKHYLKTETGYREILASTDKSLFPEETKDCIGWYPEIPQSFIEYFVSEYNKGNIITEVMVEYNSPEICENPLDSKFASLKVNPKDNTITIRKVKNSWNKEEVIKSIKNFAEKFVANTNTAYKQKEINEWIEENL